MSAQLTLCTSAAAAAPDLLTADDTVKHMLLHAPLTRLREGYSSSSTRPSPVLATNTRSRRRTASCVNAESSW